MIMAAQGSTVRLTNFLKIDDPLEAFHVHGACGILGVLCVAIFQKDKGIVYGYESGWVQLKIQMIACVSIIVWSGLTSAIYFVIS